MVQKSVILIKCFAFVGPFIMLACAGLLAGANLLVFMEYGFGTAKNQIYVWRVCLAAVGSIPARCVAVNDKAICSELTSKLRAVGIMSCIAGFNILLTVISTVAEVQGCKVPVKNLTKMLFGWSIVPTLFAIAVTVMAMSNAQCTATQSLEEQEGTYGPGGQMLMASFFGQFLGLMIHMCAMHFIGSSTSVDEEALEEEDDDDGFDEEEELKQIKAEMVSKLTGKKPVPKGKRVAPKPASKRPTQM